jgi:hypothetical protein
LISGIYAALWLLGLLAAAPALRTAARYTLADRVRDALILGVAIPFVLGLAGILYAPLCWLILALCIAIAYRRGVTLGPSVCHPERRRAAPQSKVEGRPPYFLIAALALVAWPPLMRPLLDGDSLSYHLPNAAAWVHAHGVWTTDPRYWWYPPASELFAAGMFAVSGPFALGWSGFGALALLGFRIAQWASDEFGVPPWLADALAAATVTMTPIALQAGSLQNDVWLAAFFLEALWTLHGERAATARTLAVTVLLKPYGWLFALVAAIAGKAPLRAWIAAGAVLALWIAHDALLWRGAIVTPGSASSGNTWQSTILAHGLPAIGLLVRVAATTSAFVLPALLAALWGPILAGRRLQSVGWAALAALVAFLLMPLAFADRHAQLATGASLRYAAPALALGAFLLARVARRAPLISSVLLLLCAALGTATILLTYWNDGGTRFALAVAVLAVANVALTAKFRWPIPAGFAVAVALAASLAARQPVAYYTDALRIDGKPTGVYEWIARTQPATVGGSGLRIGVVNVLAPHARAIDLPDTAWCATALQQHVSIVAVAESDRPPAFNVQRLRDARTCAPPVRFNDGLAVAAGL